MSRRKINYKNRSKYSSTLDIENKIVNLIMKNGKKNKASNILKKALIQIKENIKIDDVLNFLQQALNKIKPVVEVKSRRIGGTNYKIPVVVNPERQNSLAIRWIIQGARIRDKNKNMYKRLASEIIDAYNEKGFAYKKKEEIHKLAESNKAFAHYKM